MTDNRLIKVESILGQKHGPQVMLSWGKESGLVTSAEARQHALRVLECADAAESDAFMFHFLQKTVGVTPQAAVAVIADFRRYRETIDPTGGYDSSPHEVKP